MSNSVYKAWRYHAEYEPKIFEGESIEIAERAGWVDSPAKVAGIENENIKQDTQVGDRQEASTQELKALTVKELKVLCKERGLSGYSRLREDELIALLKG